MILNKIEYYLNKLVNEYHINIEYDIFHYGLTVFFNYLIFLLFVIPIALFLNILIETIFFILFYIPIRRYIGGFHFSKKFLCTIFSILVSILIPILAINFTVNNIILVYIIMLVTIVVTWLIGTIDHPNKRLSKREKQIFKKNQ